MASVVDTGSKVSDEVVPAPQESALVPEVLGETPQDGNSVKRDAEESAVQEAKGDLSVKDLDPENVRAPGLLDRAKEEVEAVAEAIEEKLHLNKSESEDSAAVHQDSEEPKGGEKQAQKEEQMSILKRLMKKMGLNSFFAPK